MNKLFNTVFFNLLINFSFFTILIIGIQNNKNKSTINLLGIKTVNLPVSFIIGTSFISGSITGSFLNLNIKKEKLIKN